MRPRGFAFAACLLPLFLGTAAVQDAAPALPQEQKSSKEIKVRELLELTGAAKMGKQMMDQMMTQFRRMPGLPEGFAEKFMEAAKPEDLVELIVPIYLKHVEERDLDATLEFFRTDSGKRWLAAQPAILQESVKVGQAWGQKLAMKVLAELRK